MTNRIFLTYEPRSGSTYLARLLHEKLNCVVLPETNLINIIAKHAPVKEIKNTTELNSIINLLYQDTKFYDLNISPEKLKASICPQLPIRMSNFIDSIICLYNQSDVDLWCIKKESNIKHIDYIKKIYPNSLFICLLRDPRAVCSSRRRSIYSLTNKPFEEDINISAIKWNKFAQLVYNNSKKKNVFPVTYEDLIGRQEETLKSLLNFLRLNRSTQQTRPYHIPKRYHQNLHKNINSPPLKNKLHSWKEELTKTEVAKIESICQKYMLHFGYLPTTPSNHRKKKWLFLSLWSYNKKRLLKKINRINKCAPTQGR